VDVDVVVRRVGENRIGEFLVGDRPRGHKAAVEAGELATADPCMRRRSGTR
jgi:hypothetical protein